MKPLAPLVLLALLAGCFAPTPAANQTPPAEAAPFHAEGTAWLPSATDRRSEARVPFVVNATGMDATAHVSLGARWMIDLPKPTANVMAELRGPEGETLATATLGATRPEATLSTEDLPAGAYALVLLAYGGSDEGRAGGWGDHVDFVLDAKL